MALLSSPPEHAVPLSNSAATPVNALCLLALNLIIIAQPPYLPLTDSARFVQSVTFGCKGYSAEN
ncbi:MAG: hypothetical protein ABW321_00605 [Polyangiales bacterium]